MSILMIVPTLGERLDTLGRTLASIAAQRGVRADAVLVARQATPALQALAAHHGARVIVHPGNISAAINAGLAQATEAHHYAGWLGDDDMLRADALHSASVLLDDNPAAVVAYGRCDYVDFAGALLFTRRPPRGAPALLQFVPGLIKQEACLFRLRAVRQAGGLDESLKYTMDLDLLLRLRRVGAFARSEQVLAAFCWHPGSLTIANRNASLTEAQRVQRVHSRGLARLLYPLWAWPLRGLILGMSWKINRSLGPRAKPAAQGGGGR